jgi:hypothetical protein
MFKKFFYACAAILCLVLAYHFGATSARGQSGGLFQVIPGSPGWVRVGETVYTTDFNPSCWGPLPGALLPPVSASSLVYLDGLRAITDSGEGWVNNAGGSGWRSVGTVPSTPTPAKKVSFGQLKARYR